MMTNNSLLMYKLVYTKLCTGLWALHSNLPNKHYSQHHKATEVEETKEHLEERFWPRNVDNGLQVQLEVTAQDRAWW